MILMAILIFVAQTGCSENVDRPYIYFQDKSNVENIKLDIANASDSEKPLHIAVCPILSQKSTIEAYRLIASHISNKLGRETILLERKSYAEINVLLANGGADIAFLASGAYISYTGIEDIEPLVMQIRFGLPYYYSYIIVSKDSGMKKLADLRGKTFAFTDPLSFSGFFVPTHMLKQINETPETFFNNYIFTYGHEKALQAVANKVVDAAAIGSHVYSESLEKKDGYADKVDIVAVSERSGTGPVVVKKSLGEAEIKLLQTVFLNMHTVPELREALDNLLVDSFIEPSISLYDFQRRIIQEFGLRE